jgi:hypothetical protein
MKVNFRTIISALLIVTLAASAVSCTQSKAKCKADARKAKKNKIGWQK